MTLGVEVAGDPEVEYLREESGVCSDSDLEKYPRHGEGMKWD